MDNSFKNDEKLYRAVYPPNISSMYWKSDGSVSSAAFADPNGLSVERGYYRKDEDVVSAMQMRFTGSIIRVYVKNCRDIGAEVRYPVIQNPTQIPGRESFNYLVFPITLASFPIHINILQESAS